MSFWSQFFPDLLATLTGVLAGMFAALRIERHIEDRQRMTEEQNLLRAARDSMGENLTLCDQVWKSVQRARQGGVKAPTFSMDAAPLDVICPRLSLIASNTASTQELSRFRYQLHHLNRMLDVWLQSRMEGWGSGMGRPERRKNLLDAIEKCIGRLHEAASKTGLPLAPAPGRTSQGKLP